MPHEAGQYVVEVRFAGTDGGIAGPVRGSPCRPTFVRKAAAGSNGMGGPLFSAATEKDTAQLLQSVTQSVVTQADSKRVAHIRVERQCYTPRASALALHHSDSTRCVCVAYDLCACCMRQIRDALRTRISPTLTPQELFDTLVSIKRAALRYHSRKAWLSLQCDRASEALPRLRRELLHLPAAETQLARATAVLTELVTEVPSVELRIAPLLKAQIPRLRGDIQEVESEMAAYRASVGSSSSDTATAAAARAYT
eukprot:9584-Heterococcus_DN1.PRE.1